MSDVNFYLPIAKVDRDQHMVFGYASTPTRDLDGEVIELEAIKDALPDYMEWRNIREMHGPSAVGVAKEANVDDKGLYIGAKIVDDDAWQKVVEEVYKGFSIGGDVTGRSGNTITGLKLIEISLVDRPANPDCRIDVIKAAGAAKDIAVDDLNAREREEVGWLRRMVEKLAGGAAAKADKEPYGDVEYADPGYQKDKKKRYPIDTEEHIRAAWNYIHKEKNQEPYSADQVASIKRRIVAAWKKKIDEKGPPEADKSADGHESKPVDADDLPAARDGFSRPAKAAAGSIAKSFYDVQSLAQACDMVESAIRGRAFDAAEEPDKKDAELAERLAAIHRELAQAVSDVAGHEAREAKRRGKSIQAGDTRVTEADIAKRAASGRHGEHLRKAAEHFGEAQKMCAAGMECVAKAMHARKAADGGEADHLAAAHEHLAVAHHHHVLGHHHLAKAAASHEGERGEQPGDAEGGIYQPEGGLRPLSQRDLTGGDVADYAPGRAYPGKAAQAELEKMRADLAKAKEEAAFLKGKAEALAEKPGVAKARLFAVPRGSLPVGEADEPSAMEKLLKGVDVDATDPAARQAATRKMIGNMIANSATFARPVIGDPTFRGGAAR